MAYEFAVPTPPLGMTLPPVAQTVSLWINAIMVVLAVVYLLWQTRRRGDLVPIYVGIGAIAAILYEPLADHLVLVFFPPEGQVTSIEAWGRRIPLYLHLSYLWYLAPFAVVFLEWAKKGITASAWWTSWAVIWVLAAAFEEIFIKYGLWVYYGEQPFRLIQLPLWIPFTFVCFVFAIAAGVDGIVRFIPRRYHWLIVPAVPMLITGSHTAVSLPAATALNTTQDPLLLAIAAAASIVLSLLFIWTLSLLYVRPIKPAILRSKT